MSLFVAEPIEFLQKMWILQGSQGWACAELHPVAASTSGIYGEIDRDKHH